MHRALKCHTPALAVSIAVVMFAALAWAGPSAAQTATAPAAPPQAPSARTATQSTDPNPGAMTLSGSFDVLNQYMFRGIRQNSTGLAMWPAADLGIAVHSSQRGLRSVAINLGTWNSLHTGDTAKHV